MSTRPCHWLSVLPTARRSSRKNVKVQAVLERPTIQYTEMAPAKTSSVLGKDLSGAG